MWQHNSKKNIIKACKFQIGWKLNLQFADANKNLLYSNHENNLNSNAYEYNTG